MQYQWQYLATVYDEAFIQVFTVMVSYLLCAAVIIREDDQCYPSISIVGRRRITSLMVPNGAVIIAFRPQPSTRLYTVTKQLSPVGSGQGRTSYRGN